MEVYPGHIASTLVTSRLLESDSWKEPMAHMTMAAFRGDSVSKKSSAESTGLGVVGSGCKAHNGGVGVNLTARLFDTMMCGTLVVQLLSNLQLSMSHSP